MTQTNQLLKTNNLSLSIGTGAFFHKLKSLVTPAEAYKCTAGFLKTKEIMNPETTIKICGKDVKLMYCAAAETGFERLAGKSANVFMPKLEKNDKGELVIVGQPEATTEDIIRLAYAAIIAASAKLEQDPPVTVEEILFDAGPTEITILMTTVMELRNKWYEIPATVNLDDGKKKKNEGDPKNAQTPATRTKRS